MKKREIVDTMEYIKENNSTMSNYSLIDNHRELRKMKSELEVDMKNCEYSVRFNRGEMNDDLLESLVGRNVDLDNIGLSQINSFQFGNNTISVLETFNEDQSYIREYKSEFAEIVNKEGRKKGRLTETFNDMCMNDNGDIYLTHYSKMSISCLSPSTPASKVISTVPLRPRGICQSLDGGLLVTLADNESEDYKLDSYSRRLVRHITVTGDVIHEYEYQEDGQTRLLTMPLGITQNRNSDICVVNLTSDSTGELVIISSSGGMKSVYRGQNLMKKFNPTDVVCDSLCNILVTDSRNNRIHLLSPDGEFLKFLLTKNEVNYPFSLSLFKSTLWVGYMEGLIEVFQYRM
ncbi:uncharacterized protein LOC134232157 [Saccostrea cucullata]|uniref:uncharacterized protein LOC134232157 n=1 Tax=Saccostrea cuccullata TaxID=36930 RepID=UPI002ED62DDC